MSVWGCTGWYLGVLGQSYLVLGQNNLMLIGIKCNWLNNKALMPVYIDKCVELAGCHHSGTTNDNEQGKIELLIQWTMDG